MFLHDALDVLSSNADNTLVVLIRHVERYGCWHFLLHEGQPLLHGFVGLSVDINVEVVLAKAFE